MIGEREIKNIKEFKEIISELRIEMSMYHDCMYDIGDDNILRNVYHSKMINVKAKIDSLKLDYPEYIL
jgi:hypothetical protein